MQHTKHLIEENIIVNDESINYWAQHLGCEPNILWSAVFSIGTKLTSLIAFLEMNGHIERGC